MADEPDLFRKPLGRTSSANPFLEVVERSQYIVNEWFNRNALDPVLAATASSLNIANLFIDLAAQIMAFPASVVSAQMSLWQDYFSLWQNTTSRLLGRQIPGLAPGRLGMDEQAWQDVDIFSYVKQSYMLAASCVREMIGNGGGDAAVREAVDFYARQFVSALSPASFAISNPEVIRATIETRGENLIRGLNNLLRELEAATLDNAHGAARKRFVLGRTVGATPGKVVFRNPVMEVIQYAPTRDRVLRRPLLFVPAWLNKFYILDLQETNSLVRWALDQGHTVFMISWVDPEGEFAQKSFADYVVQGPVQALDVVEQATGEAEVNAIGHGLGGTLLACALGYLAEDGDDRIKTGTFLTTMLDFSEPGELGALIDDAALGELDDPLGHDCEDANGLAMIASIQRENDLIWSFVVNNYLLGKDPFPFDLLHWNWDSPRVPRSAYKFYLQHIYRQNKLVEPDGIAVANRRIDLRKVNIPTYILSTREDHIAPWKSTYKATQLFSGPSRFTLAASGHLAGVINPPAANKYCHWLNSKTPDSPEDWRAGAKTVEGSWWRDWDAWIKRTSGTEEVPACVPGDRALKPICDAPGRYVRAAA